MKQGTDVALDAPDRTEPPEGPRQGGAVHHHDRLRDLASRFGVLGFLILVIALFSGLLPHTFPTTSNIVASLSSDEAILILALGVTLTLRLGDLDLSFGANTATTAVIVAVLSTNLHFELWLSLLIGLGFGALMGGVNALLVVKIGLNSFVATLGTMTIAEGIGFGVSHTSIVVESDPALSNFITGTFLHIPVGVWLGWALLLAIWFVYQYTPFGRLLLFIGGNRTAANLLGIPVARIRITAYILSGVIFAFGGIVLLGYLGSADPTVGSSYLLPPLSAAFLGTTAIQLGRFNAFGTLIAAYVLGVITTGLELLGASSWVGDIFDGVALLAAILMARLVRGAGASGGALGT